MATKNYHQFLLGHLRMDGHSAINRVEKILVAKEQTYVLFRPSYGDLHSYVRSRKRLRESEAIHLFHQIASIVAECHRNGIILRDLKLRKFIFANKERYALKDCRAVQRISLTLSLFLPIQNSVEVGDTGRRSGVGRRRRRYAE